MKLPALSLWEGVPNRFAKEQKVVEATNPYQRFYYSVI